MSTTRTYDVPDISCGHCKSAIESEVGKLDDVDRVEVDIEARRVTVEGAATDAEIHGAIEEAGYAVASS